MKIKNEVQQSFALSALLVCIISFSGCKEGQSSGKFVSKAAKKEQKTKDIFAQQDVISQEEMLAKLEMAVADDPENVNLKLKLAEKYSETGKNREAAELFRLVHTLYPSIEQYEYCRYSEIINQYRQALNLNKECDSSDLTETMKLCNLYLAEGNLDLHRKDIEKLKNITQERLLDKTISIFNFHLRRGNLQAAEKVLGKIKKEYLEQDPTLKDKVLYLECKLARFNKDSSSAKANLAALLEEFPESQFTKMAEGMSKQLFLF